MAKSTVPVVLWTTDDLRCVVTSSREAIGHEVQVERNGVSFVRQACGNHAEAIQLGDLLSLRFTIYGVQHPQRHAV